MYRLFYIGFKIGHKKYEEVPLYFVYYIGNNIYYNN